MFMGKLSNIEVISTQQQNNAKTQLKAYNLVISQPEKGYRFSVDALLLAEFTNTTGCETVLEIGAGSGVVSLILARLNPAIFITAIEIQAAMFSHLARNIEFNEVSQRIKPLYGDIMSYKAFFAAGSFDLVVSNPPFRKPDTGRLCPDPSEAIARHELTLDMEGLVMAARYCLKPGGRFSLIYAAERIVSLLACLVQNRLEPKRIQPIYPSKDANARMILVEAVKDAKEGGRLLAPLVLA